VRWRAISVPWSQVIGLQKMQQRDHPGSPLDERADRRALMP
jgi:hypothetical protein